MVKPRISGKQATEVAEQALERRPVRLVAPTEDESGPSAELDGQAGPPRVGKPSRHNDQCLAPTPDLENAPKTPSGGIRQDHVGRVRGGDAGEAS